ncbi:non-hydrolyzing UDP-N-acetylglucosamine 2-epimerase [Pimelobacter simplex]|uniref:UDP-N-acetylglucosamine 2-epimerase n=1 Tax=Nocardioides simplex TaxID=2045 RepID=A0A0A1DHP9_NOCSI|nr:UDP-N-acetylglucosamine 2-epimerase (non-hydrolyzing) [Pimelobacter simplex]AIY16033.1 UDP-N-acetylglucosamine 2-epimerase [Pimelobacter simplex]SFM96447.1 UDP-N-acetylglucosamine 2-epimerase (non-hydrolysing) [Pimelobacter simplex]
MKVISVVGARPQLVKLAPIAAAIGRTDHQHLIVHTGQHYDADMSDVFFDGLQIPAPDIHLGVGSGSHGAQTGAMLADLDPIFDRERPDWVLVYGDTNSTIAATLAAVKLHVPVAHLEAGLRSFNRRMPEEHNRVLTDHAADLLLAPTEVAMGHLADENLADRAVLVGDVMVDVCLQVRDAVRSTGRAPTLPHGVDAAAPYVVATLHRPDNTDDPARLHALLDALAGLSLPVVLLAHPRLVAKAREHGLELERGAIRVGPPLAYADMVATVLGGTGVLTDSGGLQKEAFLLERPCTTIRPETEWVETLDDGWNVLAPDPHLLSAEEWAGLVTRPRPTAAPGEPYGDGHAADEVVRVLAARGRAS